jgi:hypothetical protein
MSDRTSVTSAGPRVTSVERAREKQASRDADALALASGKKTVEQLRRENGVALPALDAVINYHEIPRVRLR